MVFNKLLLHQHYRIAKPSQASCFNYRWLDFNAHENFVIKIFVITVQLRKIRFFFAMKIWSHTVLTSWGQTLKWFSLSLLHAMTVLLECLTDCSIRHVEVFSWFDINPSPQSHCRHAETSLYSMSRHSLAILIHH